LRVRLPDDPFPLSALDCHEIGQSTVTDSMIHGQ
jgi:hypothetical protein